MILNVQNQYNNVNVWVLEILPEDTCMVGRVLKILQGKKSNMDMA
jgi:hypothetical protein